MTLSDEEVTVALGDARWPARKVDVGNPHAVVFVDDGVLVAEFDGDDARLTGPAVIVGRGEFWI